MSFTLLANVLMTCLAATLICAEEKSTAETPDSTVTIPATDNIDECNSKLGAETSHVVDRIISEKLVQEKLTAAPQAADAEFHRRITLDLIGRIPSREETVRWLDDDSDDRRGQLIERLLASPEMPMYWREILNHWLMGRTKKREDEFLKYLQRGLEQNKHWDDFTRDMLSARPADPIDNAAVTFLTSRSEDIDAIATNVGTVFFGVQIQCARCHDHPFVDEWQQKHYYGLAAFFNRSYLVKYKGKTFMGEKADGEIEFTDIDGNKRPGSPIFLDDTPIVEPKTDENEQPAYSVEPKKNGPPPVPNFSRRDALVEIALKPESPYLKRAIVNRVWKQLIGRGLVEPIDQIHSANPASHPQLLKFLADDFASHGYDLRRLLRTILHSQVYGRSSQWPAGNQSMPAESLYAVAILKPQTPEQLSISTAVATGRDVVIRSKLGPEKATPTAVREEMEKAFATFVTTFASGAEDFQFSAGQALFMQNSDFIQGYLETEAGSIIDSLVKQERTESLAQQAYLTILSRPPTKAEEEAIASYVNVRKDISREATCREIVWALLSSAEFLFNH